MQILEIGICPNVVAVLEAICQGQLLVLVGDLK